MRRESYLASLIVLLLAGALAAGCASTSKMAAPSPVGEWTYFIPNTPQGDVRGTIMVALEDDAYSGEMYIDILNQTVPIEDVVFTDSTFSFKALLDANGQIIGTSTSMTLNGNTMKGTMEVQDLGNFEITATRKEMEGGS